VETTEHRPTSPIGADEAEFIKAARTDDTGRFALLTERFRRGAARPLLSDARVV
jgi:RNA polymerase sigma-70 factor (ECF subfamily)